MGVKAFATFHPHQITFSSVKIEQNVIALSYFSHAKSSQPVLKMM
jgi:hypothetical protein